MSVFVPIKIEPSEGSSFQGSFPFDPEYKVTGSRNQVISKMHKAAAGYIQNSKDPKFLSLLQSDQDSEHDLIKVDLFSTYEHFFFCSLFMAAGIFGFAILFTICSWIWFTLMPLHTGEVSLDSFKEFSSLVISIGIAKGLIFIGLWNLFYHKLYPILVYIYGTFLLMQKPLRTMHLLLISFPLNLLQSKPYRIRKEVLDVV